jgi:queuine tRNA-ribosyltransferase
MGPRRVKLAVDIEATDGAARTGVVTTPRGRYHVPCFMPVGTRGAVRTLTSADLEGLGIEVMLGNTYHLMLRPGAGVIDQLGGLHGFMAWPGHVLTDSGGFQVFSLEPKLDETGATFRSTYDGSVVHLSPEEAVRIQELLGADIQMVLDVCPALPAPDEVVRDAVDLTARWAARARAAFTAGAAAREDRGRPQAQFGIVQGGVDAGLRADSARRTVDLGFDGYAVGGLSVGESRDEMHDALAATLEELPADQPRYLMGVGDPVNLVTAIGLGVDMFDCVLPTRHGRHGTVLTDGGRLNLRNARFATDAGPLDPACPCPVCARWSRGYLRHLLGVGEQVAARLVTIHNVAWTTRFVARTADAIRAGRIESWRAEVLDIWG